MTRRAAYSRFEPQNPPTFDPADQPPELVIYDVSTGGRSLSIELKLRVLPHRLRFPEIIVLRGLSEYNLSEIEEGSAIRENFPSGSGIYQLQTGDHPRLIPLLGSRRFAADEEQDVLASVRACEVSALLHFSEGIWQPSAYHFVLPSGEHADTFVRVADLLADPHDVACIADWCAGVLRPRTAVIGDTATLLPLAQELELRLVRKYGNGGAMYKSFVPSYHPPRNILSDQVLSCVEWLKQSDESGVLLVLVSVSASGAFARRLHQVVEQLSIDFPVETVVVCDASGTASNALTSVASRRFDPPSSCGLCAAGLRPIEIDQRRFTTRVVTSPKTVRLPTADLVKSYSRQVLELDKAGALAVHVDRPGHHDHLGVYIDTKKALDCLGIRTKAEAEIAGVCADGPPDVVLVPKHLDSDTLIGWLHGLGLKCAPAVPPVGEVPAETNELIATARRILVCDDAVMTSKTFRALLQHVQRVKGDVGDQEFDLRAFALIGRTEDPDTWLGLRDRFFINHEHRLRAAWMAHLPAPGRSCPWCIELDALTDLATRLDGSARAGIEERIAELSEPGGLRSGIFLGSEGPVRTFDDGKKITPQSYLGGVSELGAYVANALLMQKIRNDWKKEPESVHRNFVVPSKTFFRRYTDPIIAAGLLRAAKPRELWSVEGAADVVGALVEAAHSRQHPVVFAEALWAVSRNKLPPQAWDALGPHLSEVPSTTADWMRSLRED